MAVATNIDSLELLRKHRDHLRRDLERLDRIINGVEEELRKITSDAPKEATGALPSSPSAGNGHEPAQASEAYRKAVSAMPGPFTTVEVREHLSEHYPEIDQKHVSTFLWKEAAAGRLRIAKKAPKGGHNTYQRP